jgi:uncharacterized damage-inducible protein DinB
MNLLDYLKQQYDYVKWADVRSLEAAASVPAEAYHRDFGFSFGTVHKTLAHMIAAQDIWVGRWQGESRSFLSIEDLPTLEAARQQMAKTHDEVTAFVGRQTEASLEQRVSYVRNNAPMSGVLWHLVNHCFDHANYHRGQLNSLVKLAGGKPAATMYVDWRRQQEGQV